MRKHRALNPNASRGVTPEQRYAHKAVENALLSGKMRRCSCEVCGVENAQAHHDDYSQPLSVVWLCPKHHKERHNLMKIAADAVEEVAFDTQHAA